MSGTRPRTTSSAPGSQWQGLGHAVTRMCETCRIGKSVLGGRHRKVRGVRVGWYCAQCVERAGGERLMVAG